MAMTAYRPLVFSSMLPSTLWPYQTKRSVLEPVNSVTIVLLAFATPPVL